MFQPAISIAPDGSQLENSTEKGINLWLKNNGQQTHKHAPVFFTDMNSNKSRLQMA